MFSRISHTLRKMGSSLADFGAWLVSPIERFFALLTSSTLRASEQVERVEGLFIGVWRLVTWPIRTVGRLLPAWLIDAVLLPFRWCGRLLGGLGLGILRLAEWLNLDVVVDWFVWLLQPIWRPLAALWGFFMAWVNTRYWRGMLWGIPAAVVLVPALALAAHTLIVGQGGLIGPYKMAVREALEAKNYELAELYEKKLAQLGQDTQSATYRTALTEAEEGKLEEAYERMKQLAPEEGEGYPQAHFWIVHQLLTDKLEVESAERMRLIKVHLDQLENLGVRGEQIDFLRALSLVQRGNREEAVKALEPLTPLFPDAAFQRMRLNVELGRKEEAQRDARRLSTLMLDLSRQKQQLTGPDYQRWMAAEEVQGNTVQMAKIVEEWRKLEPENPLARQTQAVVARRQAAHMMREPLPDAKKIIDLLFLAAELDGDKDKMKEIAQELYRNQDQAPVYPQLLAALAESPRTPASVLTMLGTEAAITQRYGDAAKYFAASVERDPADAVAWNNYGLVLAEMQEPDLEKALAAVNRALEIAPEEHRFRETRGQIMLKLKRWDETIADLEFALNGLPELKAIHRSLAKAYEALGKQELAELHREVAE